MIEQVKEVAQMPQSVPVWVLVLLIGGMPTTGVISSALTSGTVSAEVTSLVERKCAESKHYTDDAVDELRRDTTLVITKLETSVATIGARQDVMRDQFSDLIKRMSSYQQSMTSVVSDIREMIPHIGESR